MVGSNEMLIVRMIAMLASYWHYECNSVCRLCARGNHHGVWWFTVWSRWCADVCC